MLTYQYDHETIEIKEVENDEDITFRISIRNSAIHAENFKKVQHDFEENKVYTDALFYDYKHHVHEVIVRKDYYVDFVLTLMKYQLIESVTWKADVAFK